MIRIDCAGLAPETLAGCEQIRHACDCFIRHGYALLDHILPDAMVQALRHEFEKNYAHYLQEHERLESLRVSGRRFMVPVALSGGFANPLVYANPFVMAVVQAVLDADAILEAFGAIVSLSGSEAQRLHPDGPPLFNADISALLPAHALTFALPLIEMNEQHGTTAIVPGSHRWQQPQDDARAAMPVVPVGSGLLWDFRLHHSGTPNLSSQARPMIYATYARDWYRDPVNFRKSGQRRLVFGPGFLEHVPSRARALFPSAADDDATTDTNRNQT
ncbi:Ectoine hydroxylase-related dioxygenase, phytanoyl-CoA dioxygenase (PhyH) family [Enhydrobacter aerosaccus]|uniref:Ectoine hydroxylase-related dioxygenase, phytanoyl-CoA dioxygenase (PhyH) family n=1 Tax=Enhydrobacter aerosaccus TaxID=225324 RepID=A0A1T4SZD0_9HYPH|nr:phytanoyl-CoA dioxygenase family protein [Enhydrobacter aerosaccus]SKA33331.1 Ectoine hydroxylase-related dioxygenase, phytanoyl-CoA dioxygenase (PhyH) family [Enhydrobacter aerosaccus]